VLDGPDVWGLVRYRRRPPIVVVAVVVPRLPCCCCPVVALRRSRCRPLTSPYRCRPLPGVGIVPQHHLQAVETGGGWSAWRWGVIVVPPSPLSLFPSSMPLPPHEQLLTAVSPCPCCSPFPPREQLLAAAVRGAAGGGRRRYRSIGTKTNISEGKKRT
jgi:hypothetical protein